MEEQRQDQQDINPFMTPIDKYGDGILEAIDPNPVIAETMLTLAGKMESGDGSIIIAGDPLLNMQGIWRVRSLYRAWVTRIGTYTKHKDDKIINHHIKYFVYDLIQCLYINAKAFNIKDASIVSDICEICGSNALQAALQAESGGNRGFVKGSTHEIKTSNQTSETRQGGLMDRLGWGKGKKW